MSRKSSKTMPARHGGWTGTAARSRFVHATTSAALVDRDVLARYGSPIRTRTMVITMTSRASAIGAAAIATSQQGDRGEVPDDDDEVDQPAEHAHAGIVPPVVSLRSSRRRRWTGSRSSIPTIHTNVLTPRLRRCSVCGVLLTAGCAMNNATSRKGIDLPISEHRLCARVARLYYESDQTQEQIGELLGLSRMKVNRLLRLALKTGVIQIRIFGPTRSTPTSSTISYRGSGSRTSSWCRIHCRSRPSLRCSQRPRRGGLPSASPRASSSASASVEPSRDSLTPSASRGPCRAAS